MEKTERDTTAVRLLERLKCLPALAPLLLTFSASLLWAVSLKDTDIYRMNGLGLVSVLPLPVFVALGLLIAGFCLALHRRQLSPPLLLIHYVALMLMLYGTSALTAELPAGRVPWRHAGITEYLARGGYPDGRLEFYFNFPGFFILSAFVTASAGVQDLIHLMAWAPLFFNLLYLGPLALILKAGTADKRLVALGIWLFYLANWIGQDYFAPQALNYFLYLVILGILLRWFKTSAAAPDRSWQRVGVMAIVVILMPVLLASHPLTAVFLLVVITALIAGNQITPRGLPILLAVMIGAWISFVATPYLRSAHADSIISEVGHIGRSIHENVGNRVRGDAAHVLLFTCAWQPRPVSGVWPSWVRYGVYARATGTPFTF